MIQNDWTCCIWSKYWRNHLGHRKKHTFGAFQYDFPSKITLDSVRVWMFSVATPDIKSSGREKKHTINTGWICSSFFISGSQRVADVSLQICHDWKVSLVSPGSSWWIPWTDSHTFFDRCRFYLLGGMLKGPKCWDLWWWIWCWNCYVFRFFSVDSQTKSPGRKQTYSKKMNMYLSDAGCPIFWGKCSSLHFWIVVSEVGVMIWVLVMLLNSLQMRCLAVIFFEGQFETLIRCVCHICMDRSIYSYY